MRVDGAVDVIKEPKLAEGKFEEGTPERIVGFMEIRNLRHVVADVQHLDGGSGDRERSGYVKRVQVVGAR